MKYTETDIQIFICGALYTLCLVMLGAIGYGIYSGGL